MPVDQPDDIREDLDKDLQQPGDEYENMEGENRSTAAEGTLISKEEDTSQLDQIPNSQDESPAPPDHTERPTLEEDQKQNPDDITS